MKERLRLPAAAEGAVWRSRTEGHIDRRLHRHDELEVNLVESGTADYLVAGQRIAVARCTLLLLFPHQDHLLTRTSADFRMCIAVFRPQLARRTLAVDPGDAVLVRRLDRLSSDRLAVLLDELAGVSDLERLNLGLAYALATAWAAYLAADRPAVARDVHPAVARAAYLLHDRPHLTLRDAASEAGLSGARLSRLFKAQLGVGLAAYRNEQRLRLFQELYGDGARLSTMQAALDAGFGSYAQFHRVFRSRMGMGPREFRHVTSPPRRSGP